MTDPAHTLLRQLPSVDKLLNSQLAADLVQRYGWDNTRDAIREALDLTRRRVLAGEQPAIAIEGLLNAAEDHLQARFTPTLRPVINATGVIIHTNLGRALLSDAAQQALQTMAAAYNTLEFDLDNGKRGSRLIHADALLRDITGAEAALVVNNCASALVLALSALAREREVIVSRGQLVEIGGGFRVPEIMVQGGAYLVEVGTTNRTRIADYQRALSERTALLLRVHASNFQQIGFTEAATLEEMAALAHEHHLLAVDDLGSGALLDTAAYGLAHEPTVQESVAAGMDLIVFSGDKLLGGPQAGLMVGRQAVIERLKKHPLARALRVDKLTYAALTATLDHYRKGEAVEHVPVWQMIARPLNDLHRTAQNWAERLKGQVIRTESTVGGGSLPGTTLPTYALALAVNAPDAFMAALRRADPPIIARVDAGRVLFDPRTVRPQQEATLLRTLHDLL